MAQAFLRIEESDFMTPPSGKLPPKCVMQVATTLVAHGPSVKPSPMQITLPPLHRQHQSECHFQTQALSKQTMCCQLYLNSHSSDYVYTGVDSLKRENQHGMLRISLLDRAAQTSQTSYMPFGRSMRVW